MSDPGITYRNREEVSEYRKTQDPILLVKNLLVQHSFATEEELKEIEKEIKNSVDEDVKKIQGDKMPAPEELFTHIYHGEGQKDYIRNCDFPSSLNKNFD